jgi:general secretion pathway protein G
MNRNGVTLVELVVTLTILSLLAALILPSTRLVAKRTKEIELRRNLRIMRTAIDDYKRTYEDLARENKIQVVINESGYPKELKTLVEGHDFNQLDKAKKRFLRRIPADPFNPPKPGEAPKWGLRSSKDEPDSTTWGEEDVFDVYSLSEEKAIDGSKYKDW